MPLTSPRVQALLAVLCAFRLLPHGFTHRDLRTCLAPLLGLTPEAMTSGQISYDLRRLRIHGLIERIPGTLPLPGHPRRHPPGPLPHPPHPAAARSPAWPSLPRPEPASPSRLRAAARAYDAAIDDLARQAGLAA